MQRYCKGNGMRDVLVIQAARFGDLVQTRRLILSLEREHRVHLVVGEGLAELAGLLYPRAVIHPLCLHVRPSPEGMSKNGQAFSRLRECDFSRIYNCNFSGITAALCRLFPEENVAGYRAAHASLGGILRSPWARAGFGASSMRTASPLNLVDFWGWFAEEAAAPQDVNPVAVPGGGGLGVVVAGREARRSLPAPILAGLVEQFFRQMKASSIKLFGTDAEKGAARQIMHRLSSAAQAPTQDLCGKTGWADLIGQLRGLDLLLTPDTGVMHLAAALGVPVMAFFLSSAWCHETGPYGLGHTIFQSVADCSPCLENRPCAAGLACHQPFATQQFLRAAARAFAGQGRLEAPPGLQIWRTGFDDLGARLELAAGQDRYEAERSMARSIIKQELRLASFPACQEAGRPEYTRLLERFLPDSEWMLPPWRYC